MPKSRKPHSIKFPTLISMDHRGIAQRAPMFHFKGEPSPKDRLIGKLLGRGWHPDSVASFIARILPEPSDAKTPKTKVGSKGGEKRVVVAARGGRGRGEPGR